MLALVDAAPQPLRFGVAITLVAAQPLVGAGAIAKDLAAFLRWGFEFWIPDFNLGAPLEPREQASLERAVHTALQVTALLARAVVCVATFARAHRDGGSAQQRSRWSRTQRRGLQAERQRRRANNIYSTIALSPLADSSSTVTKSSLSKVIKSFLETIPLAPGTVAVLNNLIAALILALSTAFLTVLAFEK